MKRPWAELVSRFRLEIDGQLDTAHLRCPCGWESADVVGLTLFDLDRIAREHTEEHAE
jgi:hypothetical protein